MNANRRLFLCAVALLTAGVFAGNAAPTAAAQEMTKLLDAPLLFVKRHSYTGIPIYDTYYKQ